MATGNIDGVDFDYVQTEKGHKAGNKITKRTGKDGKEGGRQRLKDGIEVPVGAYVSRAQGPFWIDTRGNQIPNKFAWGRTANAALKHGFKVAMDLNNYTVASVTYVYFWK